MSNSETLAEAELRRTLPLCEHIGLIVESARNGVYRCRVPLSQQNSNHLNTVHAAIQWAAAEVLGALAVFELFTPEQRLKMFAAVRSVSITFHRPARTDLTAEALIADSEAAETQRLLAAGENASFRLRASVRDEAGEIIATTDAEYVVRPLRATGASVQSDGPTVEFKRPDTPTVRAADQNTGS
jgi:acyl-coenzyme A thioesterase PaaI-like protein